MEMPVEALEAHKDPSVDVKYILGTKHSQVNAPPTGVCPLIFILRFFVF